MSNGRRKEQGTNFNAVAIEQAAGRSSQSYWSGSRVIRGIYGRMNLTQKMATFVIGENLGSYEVLD